MTICQTSKQICTYNHLFQNTGTKQHIVTHYISHIRPNSCKLLHCIKQILTIKSQRLRKWGLKNCSTTRL